jgi:hypothetical protein
VNLNWITASIINNLRISRFSHVSIALGSKLVLFGGMTERGFNSADIQVIEFNQVKVKNLYMKSLSNLKKRALK